ncbi:hypothetical protein KRX53_04425, partial [Dermabacteraceae bacterium TAE3-ERU5]|nr:hypothetical protein [Dermabacteraceae bacterium TAE3-ERU5]
PSPTTTLFLCFVLGFTAVSSSHAYIVRKDALEGLSEFGIVLDEEKNRLRTGEPQVISAQESKVTVLVFPTNEELAIARQTLEVTGA